MKEENLKELFKKVAYDEPSNNLSINIMEQVYKLEKNAVLIQIPKFNTIFIKFYFVALIVLISILTILNSQNIEIVNHNAISILSNIFSKSSFALIPIICISLFMFLLIDRKLSQRLDIRNR